MHTYRTVAGRGFMLVGIAATAWLALSMLIGGWWQVRAALSKTDAAEHWDAIGRNLGGFGRSLTGQPAQAQDAPPLMKVDLIVMGGAEPQQLCVVLPADARTVTASRRPRVRAAGADHPLTMTIRPFASTADPLVEDAVIQDSLALTIPGLGGPTCFSFENAITAEQAAGVAQAYRYFSQGVVLEVR
jgi:hypothetical protein